MDEEAVRPEATSRVVPLRVATEPPPALSKVVEQAFRIAIGLTALASDVLAEAIARTLRREASDEGQETRDEESRPPAGLPLVAGAAIGVTLETARWGARAATTFFRSAELALSLFTSPPVVHQRIERVGSGLAALDGRWREQRPRDEEAASALLRFLVPQIVNAALDQVDLNELVRERVALDRIVEEVDLDRAVARVDLDAVVARIDVDAILEKVDLAVVVQRLPMDEIVARIDLDEIVARVDLDRVVDRIDVDAVAGKLDLEALIHRIDLTSIANEVIDEIDLPEIIRESMGSMTSETVGGIRVQSMNADRAISRLVDRVLQRRADRDTAASVSDAASTPEPGSSEPEERT